MKANITKIDITALKRACILALASKLIDTKEENFAIRAVVDKLQKQFPQCGWEVPRWKR